MTNFFRYAIRSIDEDGQEKSNYKNSWVTDLEITRMNIHPGKGWTLQVEDRNSIKNI